MNDHEQLIAQLQEAGFSYRKLFFKDRTIQVETFYSPEGKVEEKDCQRWLFDEHGTLIKEF